MLRKMFFGLILAFATMLVAVAKEETQDNSPRAAILEIKGAIGPATAQYLNRGFKIAHEQKVDLIILEMNKCISTILFTLNMFSLMLI